MNTEQMREALRCCIAALERVHNATEADRLAAADKARAVLASLNQEPARVGGVPEGWKLVPVEPTKEMNVAGFNAHRATGLTGEIWRAMLTAAPQAPACVWITAADRVPLEADGEVFVRFADGSIGTAWATYWHGASNDFAQWTFPDPDEHRTVSHWMKPPAIDAARKEST